MRRAADVMIAHAKQCHIPANRVARMFAHAGDNEAALQWLERAYDNRESPLMRMACSGTGSICIATRDSRTCCAA
jgi:hypothetical protein